MESKSTNTNQNISFDSETTNDEPQSVQEINEKINSTIQNALDEVQKTMAMINSTMARIEKCEKQAIDNQAEAKNLKKLMG